MHYSMIFKVVFTRKKRSYVLMHNNSVRFVTGCVFGPLHQRVSDYYHFHWINASIWYPIQAHARAVETARSVSNITVSFFKTLDMHASKLTQIVEEAQTVNDQKLSELEEKFEVVPVLYSTVWIMIKGFLSVVLSTLLKKINVGVCC
jgi:hypothetical protein